MEEAFLFRMICGILMVYYSKNMVIGLYMMQQVSLRLRLQLYSKRNNGFGSYAARFEQLVDIQSKLSLIKLKDSNRALWASSYKFNCANTWDELRMKGQMVPWWKLI